MILRLRETGGRTIERTRDDPGRPQGAAHRHQAAVQRQGPRRQPGGALRGRPSRRRGQARCRTEARMAARAPRHQLAVVPPRRPVELRGRHPHAQGCGRHDRLQPPTARPPRSKPASTRAAIGSRSRSPDGKRARPPASPSTPAGTRRPANPTAPRFSTSPSTTPTTSRAKPRKLRIATKQGGKALVAVLSGGLMSMQEIDVPNGGGEASVAVGEDWGAGAYVTAMLYRPLDESLKRMPSRAIGVQWLRPRSGGAHAQRRARHAGKDQVAAPRLPCRSRSRAWRPARRRASRSPPSTSASSI